MVKLVALAVLLATAAIATATADEENEADVQSKFVDWVKRFNKTIFIDQVFTRFNTFKANREKVRAHNRDSNSSFTMALNEFADWTAEEFQATFTGLDSSEEEQEDTAVLGRSSSFGFGAKHYAPAGYVPQAGGVDWREKNAVTSVKYQGKCGSCWAFSANGALESAVAIKSGRSPVRLSEQQLVDCAGDQGNHGCNGGMMEKAFRHIIQNGGVCTKQAYPYTSYEGQSGSQCTNACNKVAAVSSYNTVAQSTNALQSALDRGPVSVAVAAYHWQFYEGGIVTVCGTTLNHGVLAVGYGTVSSQGYGSHASQDYWIVKNSWGVSWGEGGYIRIAKGSNSNNVCGIRKHALYPVV